MNVCERPRTVKIREEEYPVPCGSRYCASCGVRWMGDQRVCAVAAAGKLTGDVALITVTAPGREFFAAEAARDGVRPRESMRRWNETARRRWRALHLQASRPLRRYIEAVGMDWRMLMRSWEYQRRGALHLHLVMPFESPEVRRVTELYVFNLWSCARSHGFGFVLGGDAGERPGWDRVPRVAPAAGPSAARYVAKYVASTGAGKEGMVQVAQRTAMRGSVLYIAAVLTRRAGVTMTGLRARRRVATRYSWGVATERGWDAACLVDAIQAGRPPLTDEAVGRLWKAARASGATGWVDPSDGVAEPATRAARPLGLEEDRVPWSGPTRLLVVRLAPVLLRDPDRPHLGPTRTIVEEVTSIDG